MDGPPVQFMPVLDSSQQRGDRQLRERQDIVALIVEELDRLPHCSEPCKRAGAYAELAAQYECLHMYGRCLEMYEPSLRPSIR